MACARQAGRRVLFSLALAGVVAWTSGCASGNLSQARAQFNAGHYERAAALLEDEPLPAKDPILFLMERGSIRQAAGDHARSSEDLIEAARRIYDVHGYSVSQGAASFVVNDTVQEYQGAVYERASMHALTALNHFALARWDLAAVEARRIVQLLHPDNLGKYPDVAFARYIAGLAFELTDDPSNAALQYRKANALVASVEIDDASGRPFAAATGTNPEGMEGRAPSRPHAQEPTGVAPMNGPDTCELVAFVLAGRARSPDAGGTPVGTAYAEYAEFYNGSTFLGRSHALTDTHALARRTMDIQATLRATKTAARIVIKDAVANAARENNEVLGALVYFVLLGVLEAPDARYWTTMPRSLQVARVSCPADLQELRIVYRKPDGWITSETVITRPLTRRNNTFITFHRQP